MEKWKCKVCGYVHEGPMSADFACPKCKKGVRTKVKIEDDKKTRVCAKCGEEL